MPGNQASASVLSWRELKQGAKGNTESVMGCCQPSERGRSPHTRTCNAGSMFVCALPTNVCEKIIQGAQTEGHFPGWGCSFSPGNPLHKLLPKPSIKALQFANYRQDPGLVGPIRHLFLIFLCDPPLHPKLPTRLLTALRAG